MASSWFTLLFCICITVGNVESSFAQVKCSAKNVGHFGHQSLLECVVQTSPDVIDAKIRVVTWKKVKKEKPLLVFHNGEMSTQPGFRFAEPSWDGNNMNVSLLITNTTVAHDGDYTCDVITSKGLAEKQVTRLDVQAKYSVPDVTSIPEKIHPNTRSTLICKTYGGYPKGQLRWFDKTGGEWTKSAEEKVEQTDNGLFQLTSRLPLQPASTFPDYYCTLFNSSGGKEYETGFQTKLAQDSPSPESNQMSKIVAPVVVIGSLTVGLLMALLFYRRRSQRARRPSAAPLMGFSSVPACDTVRDDDCHCVEIDKEPKNNIA